ncbi:MAG: hypothetical protein AAF845_06205 [Bacteroidota bacterium]
MRIFASLLLLAALCSGCATATVGFIDMTEEPEAITGKSLVVVPVSALESTGFRMFAGPGLDVDEVRWRIPKDSLGAESYFDYTVDALTEMVEADGMWSSVRLEPPSDSLGLVEETYSVRSQRRSRSRPVTLRTKIVAPAAGTTGAFGPDVDYALLVYDAGFGFAKAGWSMNGASALWAPFGVMTRDGDDAVVMTASLVLWDNQAGSVVTFGDAAGIAYIKSRLFSSAEERSPSGLLRTAVESFEESLSENMPLLVERE